MSALPRSLAEAERALAGALAAWTASPSEAAALHVLALAEAAALSGGPPVDLPGALLASGERALAALALEVRETLDRSREREMAGDVAAARGDVEAAIHARHRAELCLGSLERHGAHDRGTLEASIAHLRAIDREMRLDPLIHEDGAAAARAIASSLVGLLGLAGIEGLRARFPWAFGAAAPSRTRGASGGRAPAGAGSALPPMAARADGPFTCALRSASGAHVDLLWRRGEPIAIEIIAGAPLEGTIELSTDAALLGAVAVTGAFLALDPGPRPASLDGVRGRWLRPGGRTEDLEPEGDPASE